MVDENHRIRFMYQNLLETSSVTKSFSSELSPMVFENSLNRFRSKYWSPSGNFSINASNCKIYINDGANKTVSIAVQNYSAPEFLATAIQSALNVASSNWTCTHQNTYSFLITHIGAATLRLSEATDAIWNDIGFVSNVDITGTSFAAEEIRIHTSEHCNFDFGYNAQVSFIALIGLVDEDFTLSTDATFRVRANNINDFAAAPLDRYCEITRGGVLEFFEGVSPYRYWQIDIIDKKNPIGPQSFKFSNFFMGDYLTFTDRNISNGLEEAIIDLSKQSTSENGTKYFERKTKYSEFTSVSFNLIANDQKQVLIELFKDVGITLPFYVSFDPLKKISSTPDQYTRFVNWKERPNFKQTIKGFHSVSISFEEVI